MNNNIFSKFINHHKMIDNAAAWHAVFVPIEWSLMDNHHQWDCAYPGVEILPDGTFVLPTYGHWIEEEQPFIMSLGW